MFAIVPETAYRLVGPPYRRLSRWLLFFLAMLLADAAVIVAVVGVSTV